MRFADCLDASFAAARIPPPLRKSFAKAGLGLLGLAALPFLSGGTSSLGPALKMVAVLGAVCALAFFALRTLARRSASAAATAPCDLKVLARASLSPKNAVALLEADGRRYLVAFGDGFATLLSNGTDASQNDTAAPGESK
jgi:hypothetical protein